MFFVRFSNGEMVILRLNENTHLYPFYCASFILELSVRIILRYNTGHVQYLDPHCTVFVICVFYSYGN